MTKVIFLTKKTDWCEKAEELAQFFWGEDLITLSGNVGDPLPKLNSLLPSGEVFQLISFLSPWIVPNSWLKSSLLSINFHPGSVSYPGIGCYNFALYEGATEYGCVCHHMLPLVDTGVIIEQALFETLANETVYSLKQRTMLTMLQQFHLIASKIKNGVPLGVANVQWSRRAFTRKELDDLGKVSPEMTKKEIQKRIRAMDFKGYPGAYMEVDGRRIEVKSADECFV